MMTTIEERVRMAIAGLEVIIDKKGVVVPIAYVIGLLKVILGEPDSILPSTPLTKEQIEAIAEVPSEKGDDNRDFGVLECAGTSYDGDLR